MEAIQQIVSMDQPVEHVKWNYFPTEHLLCALGMIRLVGTAVAFARAPVPAGMGAAARAFYLAISTTQIKGTAAQAGTVGAVLEECERRKFVVTRLAAEVLGLALIYSCNNGDALPILSGYFGWKGADMLVNLLEQKVIGPTEITLKNLPVD